MPGLVPLPRDEDDGVHTEVLWVDRFGNCQLNVTVDDLPAGAGCSPPCSVRIDDRPPVSAFGDLAAGQIGLIVDLQGLLALTFDRRSAARELRLDVGDSVILTPADTETHAVAVPMATPVAMAPGPRRTGQ